MVIMPKIAAAARIVDPPLRIAPALLLAVVEDDDVGVIGVDDDALMRTPRSTVASGAFVISVTGSSSR